MGRLMKIVSTDQGDPPAQALEDYAPPPRKKRNIATVLDTGDLPDDFDVAFAQARNGPGQPRLRANGKVLRRLRARV